MCVCVGMCCVCVRVFVWLVLMATPPVYVRTEYTYTYMGKCLFLSCHHDLNGFLCAPYFAVYACLTGISFLSVVVVVAAVADPLQLGPTQCSVICTRATTAVFCGFAQRNEYKWYTLTVQSIYWILITYVC